MRTLAKILIVEDEIPINNLIKKNLCLVGHECSQVYTGEKAVDATLAEHFDLVILDIMLPGSSGFEIISQIHKTPVIFVTAKDGIADKLKGLKLGADDYIVKPFDILELVARVEAVLRRTKGTNHSFAFDDINVDFDGRRVLKNGREIFLKPKEFSLLETLITNRNLALSRDKLIVLVWGFDFEGDTRTVDVHIQKLRQKLGLANRLKTVYKTGYRLEI